jgi:cytoskeletal protein CcmA (bactofilin family)
MVFAKAKGDESQSDRSVASEQDEAIRSLLRDTHALKPEAASAISSGDRAVASAQEEIHRLAHDGNALKPEEVSSISAGLSIVGKIVGHGALTIFGHVEGELRASAVVIAEGAQMVGDVVAEELTINGHVKGTIYANRVRLGGAGVVEGDIFHQTLAIEKNARFEGSSRRNERVIDAQSFVQTNRPRAKATPIEGKHKNSSD